MPLHSYFVLGAFIFLGVILLTRFFFLLRNNYDFIGIPTIEKRYFYAGKVAIFSTWILFIFKSFLPKLGYIDHPDYISWIAVIILWAGAIFFAGGLIHLGIALKLGLPGSETKLITNGIYQISRNPVYFGMYLISAASCIYFPDLINLSFALYGIYMHHKIIRGEEVFLARRFGTDWIIYSARVSRYL